MMVSVNQKIEELQTKLNNHFTGSNVVRLSGLLDALKEPETALIALEKILIQPCIDTLNTYNIKKPAPHELKILVTTIGQSVYRYDELVKKVE